MSDTPDPTPPEDPDFPKPIQRQTDALDALDPDLAAEYIEAFENPGRSPISQPSPTTAEGGSEDDPGGDDGGDGDVDDTPPVPDEIPPIDPEPAEPDDGDTELVEDLDTNVYSIGDWSFPRAQLPAVKQLYNWATSLPPEAKVAINQLLSGDYYLVPKSDPVQGREGSAPASPPTGAEPTPTPDSYDDYLDPRAAQDIAALRARLEQYESATAETQRVQAEQAQQAANARNRAALDQVTAQVKESYGLSDDEYSTLEQRVVARQIIPALFTANPNDPLTAFRQAFDTVYMTDPEFRARETERMIATQAAADKALAAKKAKAASVGAGSAPVPRTSRPVTPKSEQEKVDLMIREVEKSWNQ